MSLRLYLQKERGMMLQYLLILTSSLPWSSMLYPQPNRQCISGDPAYPLRVNLMAPLRGAALTAQMEAFNKSMSNVRTSVEWLFGDIVEYFKFMDFKKNLKIGLSSIGKLYVVCALLRNALTCLYGNSTSSYLELDPPTLEEYFA